MLVLTRKLNQSIMIGEIEVVVIEVRGDQVRLGINAPHDVAVHRKEIYLQVQQENRSAALAVPTSTAGMSLDEIKRRKQAAGLGKAAE